MPKPKLTIASKEHKLEGLRDGGHVYVPCSNCGAFLLDIWIVRPHEPETWKARATCPFCGDQSFNVEFKGGFYPGGYGTPNPDDEDNQIESTTIEYPETTEDGVFLFHMKKASENARPVYHR